MHSLNDLFQSILTANINAVLIRSFTFSQHMRFRTKVPQWRAPKSWPLRSRLKDAVLTAYLWTTAPEVVPNQIPERSSQVGEYRY
jgi:hypothetical protein